MKSATYHTLGGYQLHRWYSIRIEDDGESKHVFFLSRIHVNKAHKVTFSFSNDFTDMDILNDKTLHTYLYVRYGTDILVPNSGAGRGN